MHRKALLHPQLEIIPVQAERAQILAAIDRHYEGGGEQVVDQMLSEFTDTAIDFKDRCPPPRSAMSRLSGRKSMKRISIQA